MTHLATMRTASKALAATALMAASLIGWQAKAAILLDTGLQAAVVAITASTNEHFSCDRYGCYQDYEIYAKGASRFTLANGGTATAFTFAGGSSDGGFIELYRSGPGKLVADAVHLVWRGAIDTPTAALALGTIKLGRNTIATSQITYGGLSIAMAPGTYWVTLWTPFPTFGNRLALLAGDSLTRDATGTASRVSADSWHYFNGPQVALKIDATGIYAGPLPEPASWALMIAGFGLAGGSLRRRRLQTA